MSFGANYSQNLNLKTGIKTTTYKVICLYFKPLTQTFFLYDLLDPYHGSLTVSRRVLWPAPAGCGPSHNNQGYDRD